MLRSIILMGYAFLFFHLHATGQLSQYINMKYSYLSFIAIFIFILLLIVEFINLLKDSKEEDGLDQGSCAHSHAHEHDHSCCGHDHSHDEDKPKWVKGLIYAVFFVPLITGLFFPVAKLDSNIVKAKGFHFPGFENPDQYSQTQYLRPDTSVYYGADGYRKLMDEDLKKFSSGSSVVLNDKNYLNGMETLYNFPGEFMGKTLQLEGFVFHGETSNKNQLFVLRFGIIHCIADSGVYGMLVEFPEEMDLKDDDWIRVKGTLSTVYYQPFKTTIPALNIKDWSKIKEPEDTYVYRTY
ncbi:TIGR03943 family protein [Bacillus sp. M6-12]|uniref:TIGR03943 family putative permease subunit n=1 Tax=Bacillus sp. M6-12 TaxID=2054166 RepID=UPI000C77344C|nr:TIGR03943 family protein [Bacillus sp. M6-12]PLS17972.1 TIGR03943 family protein [Bacillus sp. M6-12]